MVDGKKRGVVPGARWISDPPQDKAAMIKIDCHGTHHRCTSVVIRREVSEMDDRE